MWSFFVVLALGIWLMAAPNTFNYFDPARTNDHIFGPLIAMCGLIAVTPVTRPMRWVNVPLGLWLVVAPWVLGYAGWVPIVNSLVVGIGTVVLSLLHGYNPARFGGGWSVLWRPARQYTGG